MGPARELNGVQAHMISAARAKALPYSSGYIIPEQLQRIRLETDWLSFLPARAHSTSWRVQQDLKRIMDIAIATLLLVVLLPVLVLAALLVKITSPGPVIYRYWALGHCARPFICYKFRTMVNEADAMKEDLLERNEMQGAPFKLRDDPRITPVGRFLRKFSVDELPQLWNVILGDMSLVGPRQQPLEELAKFEYWQRGKLAVRPGITCLWQVNGRSNIRDFSTWVNLDLEYIENWDLLVDTQILLRTIPAVLLARGAY